MKDEGGAAFPRPYSQQQPGDHWEPCYANKGMTLLDWFSGQALVGIFGNDPGINPTKAAEIAYACGKEMIAQRNRDGVSDTSGC